MNVKSEVNEMTKSRGQLGGVFFYFLFILSDSGSEIVTTCT